MIAGLYRRYAPELVRYIRKYTEDQAAAEDIVQETFVRGMEHGSQLDMLEESQRRAWLYRTTKNICIDRARRAQAEPPWEGEAFQNDKADGNAAVRNFGAAGQSDVLASVF